MLQKRKKTTKTTKYIYTQPNGQTDWLQTVQTIEPVSYVTLRNWVSMFTPDFINFRWL